MLMPRDNSASNPLQTRGNEENYLDRIYRVII